MKRKVAQKGAFSVALISRDPGPFFPGNGKAQNAKFPGNSRPGKSRERTLTATQLLIGARLH